MSHSSNKSRTVRQGAKPGQSGEKRAKGKPQHQRKGRAPRKSDIPNKDEDAPIWIYGRHATLAAVRNPDRRVLDLVATKNASDWITGEIAKGPVAAAGVLNRMRPERPGGIDQLLPAGAVHQGIAAKVSPLPRFRLKEACAPADLKRPVIVLDQVTDPQNIGAVIRAAGALNARAVIVQDRRTPPLAGALAKAAAGALEEVPIIRTVNISRAMEGLQGLGYYCAGLAGTGRAPISDIPRAAPVAIVMGAEGAGLRQLVSETCDGLYRINIAPNIESLNVATAAAVALYELTRDTPAGDIGTQI